MEAVWLTRFFFLKQQWNDNCLLSYRALKPTQEGDGCLLHNRRKHGCDSDGWFSHRWKGNSGGLPEVGVCSCLGISLVLSVWLDYCREVYSGGRECVFTLLWPVWVLFSPAVDNGIMHWILFLLPLCFFYYTIRTVISFLKLPGQISLVNP